MLSPFYLVHSNALAFTQFNYESVSMGNSGAKEGLLIEIVLGDQQGGRGKRKRIGETVLSALEDD